nr:ribonuclease H-like domain-containing protein [Tanacetum cinerariifolium]
KALYGLKQAHRAWYDVLSQFLIESGFQKVPTPMVEHAKLKLDLVGKPVNHTDYRSMIGSLIDKFTSRSDKCVLLGYSTVKKDYKLFSLDNRNVIFARDVKFFETIYPFKMRNTSVNDNADADSAIEEGSPAFSRTDTEATQSFENETATQIKETSLSEGNVFETNIDPFFVPTHSLTSESIDRVQSEPRRSSRVSKLLAKLNDYVIDSKLKYGIEKHVSYAKLNHVNYCFATTLNKYVETTSYYEAATDPRWVEEMNNELDALYRNHTWTIVDLHKGRKTIGNKWIYKIKYKASRDVERYKAMVLAKGFNQKEGYINNYFLYGDLVEDVYMTLPLGFGDDNGNKVCKLNKSLYGLKQAPRQWNAKLTAALIKHDFVQSKFDYSLFIKESDSVFVALLVALRVLRYLKGASGNGVQVYKSNDLSLKDFSDADWAQCPVTKKSVSGFLVMFSNCPVSWKSKKQPTISRSSAEAEYRCLVATTCEVIWMCNVLSDFKITGLFPVEIFCDSSSAIQIAGNPVFHEKTKHFEIDVHIVGDKVSAVVIKTVKIHTTEQVADIFTKGASVTETEPSKTKVDTATSLPVKKLLNMIDEIDDITMEELKIMG